MTFWQGVPGGMFFARIMLVGRQTIWELYLLMYLNMSLRHVSLIQLSYYEFF